MSDAAIRALRKGDLLGAINVLIQAVADLPDFGSASNNIFNPQVDVPYAASVALDLSQGVVFATMLTGNIAFANPVNAADGMTGCILITQDGVGNHTVTFSGSNFRAQDGSDLTLTVTAGATDIYSFVVANGLVYVSKTTNWTAIP